MAVLPHPVVSVSIYWFCPPFFNPPPLIHLFLLSTPLPSLFLIPSSLFRPFLLSPAINFAPHILSTSVLQIHLPCPRSLLIPAPLLFLGVLYPYLPQRPSKPRLNNEISASCIVLIKAVRKEVREGKYSQKQGKNKGSLLQSQCPYSSPCIFLSSSLLPLSLYTHCSVLLSPSLSLPPSAYFSVTSSSGTFNNPPDLNIKQFCQPTSASQAAFLKLFLTHLTT